MPAKVVDASVLGALIFGEPRAEEALALLKGAELYAPPLLAYELTSVARKKALKHPLLREKLQQALDIGLSLDINWTEVDHVAVLRLALETKLTTYDASYLYLARSLDLPLATFDKRLRAALKK
ncbi:type II toxin-antitoxin system VapC family toxin [Candidatus Bipolaricaulota bacterium]|nr:type II toxin-antitoxin system VapC family toxin [Candidatus Bipolaricaulota bacterium]